MEEDKLEIYIENYNNLRKGKDHISSIDKDFFFGFADMLIRAYKELKEIEQSHRQENGELRERVKELEEENQQLEAIKDEAIRRYNLESIPTSLVEETIEELNKQHDFYNSDIRKTKSIAKSYYIAIQKLQELLEKRK